MKQASPDRRPQLISSRDSVTGIVRFTGNAKLKPWMQILQANLPAEIRIIEICSAPWQLSEPV